VYWRGRPLPQVDGDASEHSGLKITTICDIWINRCGLAKPLADEKATVSKDWQMVLDDKSIDAVVIGAPDHLACSVDAGCLLPLARTSMSKNR